MFLATESPTPDLLHYKPHGRNESLISTAMWKHILLIGLYQLFWLLLMLYGLERLDESRYEITEFLHFRYPEVIYLWFVGY